MHVGTFNVKETGRPGTFESAMEKLPYLQDLGINAVEVMPIAEFPGDFSWGYNPSHPFAVASRYGGPDALKRFIKAAHEHGLAIIVDVVYNHFVTRGWTSLPPARSTILSVSTSPTSRSVPPNR